MYARAWFIALLIAGSAYFYKEFIDVLPPLPRTIPTIGKPGSTHIHASMLIMIGDRTVNFCEPKYMLKSPLVHFENNDCTTIHKHATGITLPTFLQTIGVALTSRCVTIPADLPAEGSAQAGGKHCSGDGNILRVMINGGEVPVGELSYRELKNNDHILINLGKEDGTALRFKYNQVPMIPLDVNEPTLQ